jgi:nitronate monooxygenase
VDSSETHAALSTPLCDLLGVRYPIIQAPMAGGWTTPELVSAVSNVGGFGVLAGAGVSPEQLRENIRAVRERTDRPFGVNFLLAPEEPGNRDVAAVQRFLDRFRKVFDLPPGATDLVLPPFQLSEQLEVVFEERVPVLSTARLRRPTMEITRPSSPDRGSGYSRRTVWERRRSSKGSWPRPGSCCRG